MTGWGVTAGCLALMAATVGCGADDAPTSVDRSTTTTTTSTAPERPVTTPSTIYAPDTVEGQVEAAYLESWEVYADAVYHLRLDEADLERVFAEDHLQTKLDEIRRRISEGRAALVRVEHDYTVQLVDESTAVVVDEYRNHQRLIDPITKKPIEPDPDELVSDAVTMHRVQEVWRVVRKDRLS